jgi:carboxymethylenebutenolidase
MNEIQKYLVEEHVEDFEDGLISRRELLRRCTLILGSGMAAATFLAACGVGETPTRPVPAASTSASAPPAAGAGSAAVVPFATPPSQPTTDGITVKPDDPRITAGAVSVKAADGASLIGYMSRPKADGTYPGIVVVHENRGLLEHIKDVTRRYATAGFSAVSVDLVSRDGGADKLSDQAAYNAALGKRPVPEMVKDLQSALDHLRAQSFVNTAKTGITGFCFGGGMVWSSLNAGMPVQAAVPYYGPAPSDVSGIGATKAAVLAVYAELDTRVTSGKDTIEPQLRKAGVPYKIIIYPGVNHAFHNDTNGPQRYGAEQAQKAWLDTIDWFKKYL